MHLGDSTRPQSVGRAPSACASSPTSPRAQHPGASSRRAYLRTLLATQFIQLLAPWVRRSRSHYSWWHRRQRWRIRSSPILGGDARGPLTPRGLRRLLSPSRHAAARAGFRRRCTSCAPAFPSPRLRGASGKCEASVLLRARQEKPQMWTHSVQQTTGDAGLSSARALGVGDQRQRRVGGCIDVHGHEDRGLSVLCGAPPACAPNIARSTSNVVGGF